MVFICKIYKYRVLLDKYPTSGPAWRAGTYFFTESSGHICSKSWSPQYEARWLKHLIFQLFDFCRLSGMDLPWNESNSSISYEQEQHTRGYGVSTWMKYGRGEPFAEQSNQKHFMKRKVLKQADSYIQSLTNRSVCSCRYSSRTLIFFGRRQKHGCCTV